MSLERQRILETVAQGRAGVLPRRNLDFAEHAFRIPMQDYRALCMLYPLNSRDPVEHAEAWKRFEKSQFSEPYRTSRKVHGVFRK